MIGWAKPVPVNPSRLRNRGATCCSCRSPVRRRTSCSAIVAASSRALLYHRRPTRRLSPTCRCRSRSSLLFAVVNLFLGVFNFLPIPPLDGAALIERVLPESGCRAGTRSGSTASSCCSLLGVLRPHRRSHHRAVARSPRPVHLRMSRAAHLTGRFFGSLRAAPARRRRRRSWVQLVLTPEEFACVADARPGRSGGVGRRRPPRRAASSAPMPTTAGSRPRCCTTSARPTAGLGTFGRAGATTVGGDRQPRPGPALAEPHRPLHRPRRLGAARLQAAAPGPRRIAWAAAHHRPERWPPDGNSARNLRDPGRADGER